MTKLEKKLIMIEKQINFIIDELINNRYSFQFSEDKVCFKYKDVNFQINYGNPVIFMDEEVLPVRFEFLQKIINKINK